jgi:hypothetical protein
MVAGVAWLVTLAVYLRALSCDFINFDDPQYVIENTGIRSLGLDFWYWSFCTIPLNYWTPLLWISFAIDYRLWGLDPFGYHLTNILLHALNAALFVLLADHVYGQSPGMAKTRHEKRLYLGIVLVAGLLFALHPARVESVAWVTERKDVLNGAFTLGFLICYLRYLQKKSDDLNGRGKWREYVLSLLLFVFSMLIKPSSFLIPMALLFLDWYPLRRFDRDKFSTLLLEKIPFMLLGAIIVAISIIFRMKQGGFNSLSDFPMAVRTVAAGNSLVEYFRLMLFPVNILPYYILPRAVPVYYIYKALAAFCFIFGIILFRKRFPALTVSVLFFVVTILPSLHFLTDGYQTVLSPRYTYLPSILACIVAAPALVFACRKIAPAAGRYQLSVSVGLVAALLTFYAATTVILIADWKNSGVMWSKVIATKPFDKAYYYRGLYLAEKGEYRAAIKDYSTCIELATRFTLPDIHNVYAFRGDALAKAGDFQAAVDDFTTAISLYPHPLYYYHRGELLRTMGRVSEANADLAAAGQATGSLIWLQ